MRAGNEVEEDGRVDGEIPTDAEADDCEKRRERDEVGRAACCQPECACEEERDVEAEDELKEVASILIDGALVRSGFGVTDSNL